MQQQLISFLPPHNAPLQNQNPKNTLKPKHRPQNQDPLFHGQFLSINEDSDHSFLSAHEKSNKKNAPLSKVSRKQTRQTDPEPFDQILRIQQTSKVQIPDPVQQIIKKSQLDPFLRRKLKAVVENDLKCLKKLNDQKNNVSSKLSKTIATTQSVKLLPKSEVNPIDEQISRVPRDISKILNTSLNMFSSPSGKRIQSQSNIMGVVEESKRFLKKKESMNEELSHNGSFTTLRRELYKKKLNCLEVLRVVKQKSIEKGKKE